MKSPSFVIKEEERMWNWNENNMGGQLEISSHLFTALV